MSERRRWAGSTFVVAALTLALAGCASTSSSSTLPGRLDDTAGRPDVYAAMGASETAGFGINDQSLRLRAAWPQLFFNEALSRAATYYNYGIPGITASDAMSAEVPAALMVHPTVVTVFFGGNDILGGVSPGQYEQDLGAIVHAMRQGGRAAVLVANVPPLDHLPAVLACLPGAPIAGCGLGRVFHSVAALDAVIQGYDDAVARVAAREGATVVDLHSQGATLDVNPDYVSADGFHPTPLGHAAIAQVFVTTYRNNLTGP